MIEFSNRLIIKSHKLYHAIYMMRGRCAAIFEVKEKSIG
jgi:hypothetical protein